MDYAFSTATFPSGTTVYANALDGDGEPVAALVSAGVASFVGLREATDYVVHAYVAGAFKQDYFRSPSDAGLVESTGAHQHTFVLFGDSMTLNNGPTFNIPGSTASDNGFWNWARFYLGQRVTMTQNLGVSGENSTQILARLGTATVDTAAHAIVLGGTNSIADGFTIGQITADLQSIYDGLRASGKTVVAITIIPRTTVSGPITVPQKRVLLGVNRWIRTYCRDTTGMVLCDPYPYMMDKNGDPAANVLETDGLHPARLGAQIMGRVLASVLALLVPGSLHLNVGRGQGDPYNHLDYSVFDGTTGGTASAFAGTTVAGTIAQGWTLATTAGTGTVTGSLVARADGVPGYWQQLVVSGGSGLYVELHRNGRSEGLTGQGAISRMELDASTDDWTGCVEMSLQCKDNGNSNYGQDLAPSAGLLAMTAPGYGVLESPRVLPTADATSQLCRLRWKLDAGTIRVGSSSIRYPTEA